MIDENVPEQLTEMEAQRDVAFDEWEWLKAHNCLTPAGSVNIDLEDKVTRAELKWLDLVVACMAWAGNPPAVPGFLN
jgi:hypothetical protein